MRLAALPALAVAGGVGLACANIAPPPGGPTITTPPAVIAARPESGAVVPGLKGAAVLQFDAVLDEMASAAPAGGGPEGLGRYVMLSPVAGEVRVGWHRSSISIEPKEGWKPGRVYHLQLLPGITDLRRNIRKRGQSLVFSTGPQIPAASITGTAVLWVEQRLLTQGLIRAVPLPDTVGYLTQTDSTGRFQLDAIPPGRYVVYALQDQNGNRQRDRREAYDSAIVAVDSTAAATLWAFVHDTLGPRGRGADPIDSITFRVNFTQPFDPAEPPDSARVRVVLLPDSTPVPVAAVLSQARYDSLAMRERAIADSLKRAADTTHKDTTARRDTTPVLARRDTTRPAVPIDTSSLKRLLAQRPVPADHVVIRVAAPLAPNTRYHILVRGVRNLNGATADAQAVLTVPKPAPPPKPAARDSTRAVRDTTKP